MNPDFLSFIGIIDDVAAAGFVLERMVKIAPQSLVQAKGALYLLFITINPIVRKLIVNKGKEQIGWVEGTIRIFRSGFDRKYIVPF